MDDRVSLWGGLPDKDRSHPMAKKPWAKPRDPGASPKPWNPKPIMGLDEFDPRQRLRFRIQPKRRQAKVLHLDTSLPIGMSARPVTLAPKPVRRMGKGRRLTPGIFVLLTIMSAAPVVCGAFSSPTTLGYWKDRFWAPTLMAVPLRNAFRDDGGNPHTALVVTGAIGPASATALSTAISKAELVPGDAIVLSSPGGDLGQALIMGEEIRRRQLYTVVGSYATGTFAPSHCASACITVFAGGVHRIQVAGSRLGVHQFSADGVVPDDPVAYAQREAGDLMAYFARMGVDPMVVQVGSGSRDVRWLAPEEVMRLGLADLDIGSL